MVGAVDEDNDQNTTMSVTRMMIHDRTVMSRRTTFNEHRRVQWLNAERDDSEEEKKRTQRRSGRELSAVIH
jgi:hypothetical protein